MFKKKKEITLLSCQHARANVYPYAYTSSEKIFSWCMYVCRLLFISFNSSQAFLFERMICSVLPRPAGTVHVARTRRRSRGVPGFGSAVVVYDVGVADRGAVIEGRGALGSQVVDGGRCNASLRDVHDWKSGNEMAGESGCAALWDLFLRRGSTGSAVDLRVESYVAASSRGRVGLWWWRWCVWRGCL